MKVPESLQELTELSQRIHTYNSILTLLHWDQETYMPPGGIGARSQQIAELSHLIHEEKTSKKFHACLEKLAHVKHLSREQEAMHREWLREWERATKLPASFVKTYSQVTSEASQIWSTAKKENNYKLFAPFLSKILKLAREKAAILGFSEHPYDALLESYEPCMTTKRVALIFKELKEELVLLLGKVGKKSQVDNSFLKKKVDEKKQHKISLGLLEKLPLDHASSRLDLSAHPFSLALHPTDSRITTRFLPHSFLSNIFSILHEVGHSLYEMGLPSERWGTPLGEPVSLTIHESQSRWWETLIGRSLPFWKFYYPSLRTQLPFLKRVPLERFYSAMHTVTPSFIRVEADEVTYCLHVILRFEIEQLLISDQLQVADLPEAWNHKMKELLGIVPPTDSQGCLQDIHWSLGDFGYFPTYALGNLAAAQFFATFAKAHPDWEKRVAVGELGFIRDWLKENIHRWGKIYNTDQLIKRVTDKPLSPTAYCHYLKNKYTQTT